MTRGIRVLAGLAALFAVLPAAAGASKTQESILMDDPTFVSGDEARVDRALAEVKQLGVDRIRVSLLWHTVAPDPVSRQRPEFPAGGARDPAAYPPQGWAPYDRLARLTQKHQLGLLFTITGPAPLWATGTAPRARFDDTWTPNAADFGDFVHAVGTRYSGTYDPPTAPVQTQSGDSASPLLGLLPAKAAQAKTPPPRVSAYSIWNEPNHSGWLTPQSQSVPGRRRDPIPMSPVIYRRLVDAAWRALTETGHGADTILIGETAPRGGRKRGVIRTVRPIEFVRELYCLDRAGRPYSGSAARVRACPAAPATAMRFAEDHPGLFRATGLAHHPYGFGNPPATRDKLPENVPLANVRGLVRTLDMAFRRHGQAPRMQIFLTEYGYQTNPPDPFAGISWRRQAKYLSEAEYLAFQNPRIASMAQFLFIDDGPRVKYSRRDHRHWGTFQTGLVTPSGVRKSSYEAYQRPFHIGPAVARPGQRLRWFGALRPAAAGVRLQARLEFQPERGAHFVPLTTGYTTNVRGYATGTTRARGSGTYRLHWSAAPDGSAGAGPSVGAAVEVRRGR